MNDPIEFGGAMFDDRTDWRIVVRHPYVFLYRPFERDLDAASALGALAEALSGTALECRLGDAALEVIEQGDESAMEGVLSAGWEKAPNAVTRILALVTRKPAVLSRTWMVRGFGALLRLAPNDPGVLTALEREAQATDGHRLLEAAARYNPRWLAEQLPLLRPPITADFASWLWVAAAPEAGTRIVASMDCSTASALILDAIADLGDSYRAALLSQYSELACRHSGTNKQRYLHELLSVHRAFSAGLANSR